MHVTADQTLLASARSPATRQGAEAVVWALLYLAVGATCLALSMTPTTSSPLWAPSGLVLGGILWRGRPALLGAAVGAVVLDAVVVCVLQRHSPAVWITAVAVLPSLTLGQYLLGGHLIRRTIGFPTPLDDARDVGRFVVIAAGTSLAGALASSVYLWAIGLIRDDVVFAYLWTWWIGDALGTLIFTPLVFVVAFWRDPSWRRRLVSLMLPLGLTAVLIWLSVGQAIHLDENVARFGSALLGTSQPMGGLSVVLGAGLLIVVLLESLLLVTTGRSARVHLLVAQRTRELEASNRAVEEQRAELARSNAELERALGAKEVLLKELHHRVKNNLQVISSLFSLQARYLPDPRHREVFEESRNRVFSIALAHEKLYRSKDLARIDFSEYTRQLVEHLQASLAHGQPIKIEPDIQEVRLPIDLAIPCGLVINELVSNALKHAFPAGRKGTIRVILRETAPERWLVGVEDDGIGLPSEVELGRAESLGLDLVSILATQLGGQVEVGRTGGTSFRLTFGGGN